LIIILILPYTQFFLFADLSTPRFITLSLHDALPILAAIADLHLQAVVVGDADVHQHVHRSHAAVHRHDRQRGVGGRDTPQLARRSEEHTSELQSLAYLVCRLLLEKKKVLSPITAISR